MTNPNRKRTALNFRLHHSAADCSRLWPLMKSQTRDLSGLHIARVGADGPVTGKGQIVAVLDHEAHVAQLQQPRSPL